MAEKQKNEPGICLLSLAFFSMPLYRQTIAAEAALTLCALRHARCPKADAACHPTDDLLSSV